MRQEGIITAYDLAIGYRTGGGREKHVHDNLALSLRPGMLTCLIGPNGAGKSTLLRTLGGSQPPLSGSILLGSRSLERYSLRERSRQIGMVLTDKTHAGGLRVAEVVALGRHPHLGFFGHLHADDRQIVQQAMQQAGIDHKAESYLAELSDGERQKAMIAKTLAQECPIILLDEPTAFLDITSRIEVMHLLRSLAGQGKTILLSTHDIDQALALADRLWLLSRNDGLRCGTPEDLVLDGEINRFFDRGAIAFDPRKGNFRIQSERRIPVRIEAEGTLRIWAENLLTRYGYYNAEAKPEDQSDVAPTATGPGCPYGPTDTLKPTIPANTASTNTTALRITVRSPQRIEVSTGGALRQTVTSFEALSDLLKNNSITENPNKNA